MSDLISRQALERKCKGSYLTPDDFRFEIRNAPAIEQGEVVIDKAAYDGAREDLSIWKRRALEAEEKVRKYDQRIVDIGVIAMTPVTTPQQSQEQGELVRKAVADALEEVNLLVLDEKIAVSYQSIDGYRSSLLCAIRTLIKRNAEECE